MIAQLNDNTQANAVWRENVIMLFRNPGKRGELEPSLVPQIFGDEIDYPNNALAQFVVTKTQYAHLRRWAAGSSTPGKPDRRGTAQITPEALSSFAREARLRIRAKDGSFRRHHLHTLVQRVEVGTGEIRTKGSKMRLLQTLVASGGKSGVETSAAGVRSFVPNWLPDLDSNQGQFD